MNKLLLIHSIDQGNQIKDKKKKCYRTIFRIKSESRVRFMMKLLKFFRGSEQIWSIYTIYKLLQTCNKFVSNTFISVIKYFLYEKT